jgi:hypothetical protein
MVHTNLYFPQKVTLENYIVGDIPMSTMLFGGSIQVNLFPKDLNYTIKMESIEIIEFQI